MNKFITIAALSLCVGSANAYEYKHAVQSKESDRAAAALASVIEFSNDSLSSIELIKAKQNLAKCSIDMAVKDISEHDLGQEYFLNMFETLYSYHRYGQNLRDQFMSQPDVAYVNEINFRCIAEHPDKSNVIHSYVLSSNMFEKECDGQPKCFIPKKLKYVEQLNLEYNI